LCRRACLRMAFLQLCNGAAQRNRLIVLLVSALFLFLCLCFRLVSWHDFHSTSISSCSFAACSSTLLFLCAAFFRSYHLEATVLGGEHHFGALVKSNGQNTWLVRHCHLHCAVYVFVFPWALYELLLVL
jgi:hypothetical protein